MPRKIPKPWSEYTDEEKLKHAENGKKWRDKNKDRINEKARERRKTDEEFRDKEREYFKDRYHRDKAMGKSKYKKLSPEQKAANKLVAIEKQKNTLELKKASRPPNPKKEKYNQPFKDKTPEQQERIRETKRLREAASPDKYKLKEEERKRIHKEKMATDPVYAQKQRDKNKKYYTEVRRFKRTEEEKMYNTLKSRIKRLINIPKHDKKVGGVYELVGCDRFFLRKYIESQFVGGMSWDNWGDVWHIDHVIPFSLCNGNKELAIKLSHYTNLRPLCRWENQTKKDKFIPELWPKDFPYPPEDFGLDRKTIPFFNQTAEQGHALDSTQHYQENATTTLNQESCQTDQPISGQ